MFNTVTRIPRAGSLEDIGDALVDAAGTATDAGVNLIKRLIDEAVVPFMLIALLLLMLFFIAAYAFAKRRREGEDASKHLIGLAISFLVFLLIAGYGFIFGGLLSIITGA